MPCDTISRMFVDVGKMDPATVMRALQAEGMNPTLSEDGRHVYWPNHEYDADEGTVRASGRYINEQKEISKIKTSYSSQVVRDQAKKFGWTLKATGKNKFTVIKR